MTDATEEQRLYVIGDVHGRLDLLRYSMELIHRDLIARPHSNPHVIFLGDYIDRGPDSKGVIDALITLRDADIQTTFLLGNHDDYIRIYLHDPEWFDRSLLWLHPKLGGSDTLASYGVEDITTRDPDLSRRMFSDVFPAEHEAFLESCEVSKRIGRYFFAHAGIRPGVPLALQERQDLLWIRDPFLKSRVDHGVKVVHGHTPVPSAQHHNNRIAIDTRAYKTNILTCLVLEGDDVSLLEPDGLRQMPPGTGLDKGDERGSVRTGLRGLFRRRGS